MEATKEAFFDKLNNEQQAVQIPYYLHEGEMFRLERLNKRWFIAFLIVLVMLFVTNGAWIVYEMQYETYYYSQDVKSDSANATALLNTGEGSVTYNGYDSETSGADQGQEDERIQSDQGVPNL